MRRAILLLMAVVFENRIADADTLVANICSRILRRGGD
jgi:hypothetical protein